jgi:hypothetical protein
MACWRRNWDARRSRAAQPISTFRLLPPLASDLSIINSGPYIHSRVAEGRARTAHLTRFKSSMIRTACNWHGLQKLSYRGVKVAPLFLHDSRCSLGTPRYKYLRIISHLEPSYTAKSLGVFLTMRISRRTTLDT